MCPPPFDPVRLVLPPHGIDWWFVGFTIAELGLLGAAVKRVQSVTRIRLRATAQGIATLHSIDGPKPWLWLVAAVLPILQLALAVMLSVARGATRAPERIAQEAVLACLAACHGVPCVGLALVVIALGVGHRTQLQGLRRAFQTAPNDEAIARTWLEHPGVEARPLLMAVLVFVLGGAIPFAAAVMTYVNLVFPVPHPWYVEPSRWQDVCEWHWDVVARARVLLFGACVVAIAALVVAIVLALRALEAPARIRHRHCPSMPVAPRAPSVVCIAITAVALSLTVWLAMKSVTLRQEIAAPLHFGYEWAQRSQHPFPLAASGEGPDLLTDTVMVEQRRSGTFLDGTAVSPTEFAKALDEKRKLWLLVNPGRTFPNVIIGFTGEEQATSSAVWANLRIVRAAGFSRAQFVLRNCVRENRPVLGVLWGCHASATVVDLDPSVGQDEHCVEFRKEEPYGEFVRRLSNVKRSTGAARLCSRDEP